MNKCAVPLFIMVSWDIIKCNCDKLIFSCKITEYFPCSPDQSNTRLVASLRLYPIVVHGPFHGRRPKTFKVPFSPIKKKANKIRRQKNRVEILLLLTFISKEKAETARNFPNLLKRSTLRMFGFASLDARLNISRILGEIAFLIHKHQTQ